MQWQLRFADQADGSAFEISVAIQPDGQTCTLNNGSGNLAGADVINVSVTCVNRVGPPVMSAAIPVMPRWLLFLTALTLMLLALKFKRRGEK